MGRKSTRENKNVYPISREAAGLTREAASEVMGYISSDRIEKIEYETSLPQPEHSFRCTPAILQNRSMMKFIRPSLLQALPV